MSHEITNTNGKNEMAYVGEKPWHGLGQELPEGASIEEWLKAAGMEWKVSRSVVRYATDRSTNGGMKSWPDKHVLFRSDTKAPLGVVSDNYKIVQPKAVLEFFRDLAASNNFKLATAGTLKGGTVYWALAEIGANAFVGKGDRMRGHVLLSTSADGSRRTEASNVATRVVCANTLAMADGERGVARVKVSHRSMFDADAVKVDMGIAVASFDKFMIQARALASRKVSDTEIKAFMLNLLAKPTDIVMHANMEEATKVANEVLATRAAKAIMDKLVNGRGAQLATAQGTAWGLVNAVTEYVDHDYPARSVDNRLNSAWFGVGAAMKSKAMELAVDMV